MNILYLSHRVPYPPNKGEKIHVFNTLRYLSKYHSIHLIAFNTDPREEVYRTNLLEVCKTVDIVTYRDRTRKIASLMSLARGRSATEGYFYTREIQDLVNCKVPEVDLIIAESSSMASYVMEVKCPVIADLVDVDSDKWAQYAKYAAGIKKWIYQLESRRVDEFENRIAGSVDHLLLVTPKEVDFFKKKSGVEHVSILMNGVDTAYFYPKECERRLEIVFTGALDYFANVDGVFYFYEHIWPLILKDIPDARWVLVGSNPCAEIIKLSQKPQIELNASVPDVRPYLWRASVSVTPLRIARGIQNKVLEAMASGVPVVCTGPAFEGLKAVPGEDLFVENDSDMFARQVVKLMRDHECASRMRQRGIAYVHQQHNWEKNLKVLKDLCEELHKLKSKIVT